MKIVIQPMMREVIELQTSKITTKKKHFTSAAPLNECYNKFPKDQVIVPSHKIEYYVMAYRKRCSI